MSAKDEFSFHEALHTAHVLICAWSDHVTDHPAVKGNKKLREAAENAERAMADVYQIIGAEKYSRFTAKRTRNPK